MVSQRAAQVFFAAIAVTIYAEIFARIKKTPTSTFLIVPMIPLIPGGVLYYTMSYALKMIGTIL